MSGPVVLLIPAFRPSEKLPALITSLIRQDHGSVLPAILVVDDGSGPEFAAIFGQLEEHPQVVVLRHAVNLGKCAALKTRFNHCLLASPDAVGVVTADADGQH